MSASKVLFSGISDKMIHPQSLNAVVGRKIFVKKNHGRFWLEVLPEAWVSLVK